MEPHCGYVGVRRIFHDRFYEFEYRVPNFRQIFRKNGVPVSYGDIAHGVRNSNSHAPNLRMRREKIENEGRIEFRAVDMETRRSALNGKLAHRFVHVFPYRPGGFCQGVEIPGERYLEWARPQRLFYRTIEISRRMDDGLLESFALHCGKDFRKSGMLRRLASNEPYFLIGVGIRKGIQNRLERLDGHFSRFFRWKRPFVIPKRIRIGSVRKVPKQNVHPSRRKDSRSSSFVLGRIFRITKGPCRTPDRRSDGRWPFSPASK